MSFDRFVYNSVQLVFGIFAISPSSSCDTELLSARSTFLKLPNISQFALRSAHSLRGTRLDGYHRPWDYPRNRSPEWRCQQKFYEHHKSTWSQKCIISGSPNQSTRGLMIYITCALVTRSWGSQVSQFTYTTIIILQSDFEDPKISPYGFSLSRSWSTCAHSIVGVNEYWRSLKGGYYQALSFLPFVPPSSARTCIKESSSTPLHPYFVLLASCFCNVESLFIEGLAHSIDCTILRANSLYPPRGNGVVVGLGFGKVVQLVPNSVVYRIIQTCCLTLWELHLDVYYTTGGGLIEKSIHLCYAHIFSLAQSSHLWAIPPTEILCVFSRKI